MPVLRTTLPGPATDQFKLPSGAPDALLRAQFPVTKGICLLGISISALNAGATIGAEQLPLDI
jgi:hypothetical protein